MPDPLTVFISATTRDLGKYRESLSDTPLAPEVHRISQDSFPADYRSIREILRKRIAECDAVIRLAGKVYGAEPGTRELGAPRMSHAGPAELSSRRRFEEVAAGDVSHG